MALAAAYLSSPDLPYFKDGGGLPWCWTAQYRDSNMTLSQGFKISLTEYHHVRLQVLATRALKNYHVRIRVIATWDFKESLHTAIYGFKKSPCRASKYRCSGSTYILQNKYTTQFQPRSIRQASSRVVSFQP